MNRRGFLTGLIAAPAIVAASNIMSVRSIERLSYASGGLISGFDNAKIYALGDIIACGGIPWIVVETNHRIDNGSFSEHLSVRSLLRLQISPCCPVYEGRGWPTDCTCAVRKPGRVLTNDKTKWVLVCLQCGSLRENTGT